MVASIADKLTAMKASRDQVNHSTGRGLVVLKASVVDAEFDKLDLNLRAARSTSRMVSHDGLRSRRRCRSVAGHQPRDRKAVTGVRGCAGFVLDLPLSCPHDLKQ